MGEFDFLALAATVLMAPFPDEQYDRKSSNDADSCSTLRAGGHRIYLPAPFDAQAGPEV
jgi:hypothetical protein